MVVKKSRERSRQRREVGSETKETKEQNREIASRHLQAPGAAMPQV